MKLPRKWRLFIASGIPLAVIACFAFYARFVLVSETLTYKKGDTNWDLKALSALVSLMNRRPYALSYSVSWNEGRKDLASYSYSAIKQELIHRKGYGFLEDTSLLGDTSIEISQRDLKAARLSKIHYYQLWQGWREKGWTSIKGKEIF